MKDGSVEYYDSLGEYWDAMDITKMGSNHKDEVRWVDQWRKKLNLSKKVLDIACGTGEHLKHFKQLGYECRGLDLSIGMLEMSRKKLPSVILEQKSFRKFKTKSKYPVITCFSAMTHNSTKKQFQETLRRVREALIDDGIFVFEVPDANKYRKKFLVDKFKKGKVEFSRNFIGIPLKNAYKSHSFFVFFDGKSVNFIKRTVIAGRYSEKEVEDMLKQERFKLLYAGEGFRKDSQRKYIVYVAKKDLI